jgi:hypothetical protein
MRSGFLAIAACLTASFPLAALAESTPEQVAEEVVHLNADYMTKHREGDISSEPSLMRKYFTSDFVTVWKCAADTGKDVWDGDFITGAQNLTGERLVAAHSLASLKESTPVNVDIEIQSDELPAGTKPITHEQFVFRREDGAWKIDEIINLDAAKYEDASHRAAVKQYKCK